MEENDQLRSEFRSFQSLVIQYLPPDAQTRLQQPHPLPNPNQQNYEIPQPQSHPQQQNNQEDENLNEESSPDYEDY